MREVVTDIQAHGVSERKACEHMGLSRSSMRYEGKGPDPKAEEIKSRVKDLAMKHKRYGYRRVSAETPGALEGDLPEA